MALAETLASPTRIQMALIATMTYPMVEPAFTIGHFSAGSSRREYRFKISSRTTLMATMRETKKSLRTKTIGPTTMLVMKTTKKISLSCPTPSK